jgi:hypothetical protein
MKLRILKSGAFAAGLISMAALTGCYVVPISQYPAGVPAPAGAVPAPGPVTLGARLYPANDVAAAMGVLNASIVNHLDGRGVFSVNAGGEQFNGEATRMSQSRSGTANAAGNRGGYMRCNYTMNNATQGTGTCTLSTGATFNMHVGQ